MSESPRLQESFDLGELSSGLEQEKKRQTKREQLLKAQDVAVEAILAEPLILGPDDEPPEFRTRMEQALKDATKSSTTQNSRSVPSGQSDTKEQKDGKKKKNSKPSKAEALGFENFYADCPLTPVDAMLESELYSTDRTATMRMQDCIQRYRTLRRLNTGHWRRSVFDAYLTLGGISTGQKDYGGAKIDPNKDSEHDQKLRAIDFVDEQVEAEQEEVEFLSLVQAFLSARCLSAAGQTSPQRAFEAPDVVINFLKYVNYHNVLPEYREQIDVAIVFAETAKGELRAAKVFSLQTPGSLNTALSRLGGGYYYDLYTATSEWEAMDTSGHDRKLLTESEATLILESNLPLKDSSRVLTIKRKEFGLPMELVRLEPFTERISWMFLKPWKIPGAHPDDQVSTDVVEIRVPLENSIASNVYPQLHIEANFYQLEFEDFWFFDTITRVLPSFYVEIEED